MTIKGESWHDDQRTVRRPRAVRRSCKSMLEERRREIQDKLRSLRETLPAQVDDVQDAEEQSVDDFVQEVDFALMEMKSETLGQIDEALRGWRRGPTGPAPMRAGDRGGAPQGAALRHPLPDCQEQEERREATRRAARHRGAPTRSSHRRARPPEGATERLMSRHEGRT